MSATSLDRHLQNGKGESLARAREALKGRLKQKMMHDVLDELQDTEQVVNEAMTAFAAHEEVLEEAKKAYKARLHAQLRRQAIEEVIAEAETENLEGEAQHGLLAGAKDAFKQRLFDHVLQQAIHEVGEDLDGAQQAVETHGEALDEAREAFKARLRDQVIEQAVAAARAEVSAGQDALETHGEALDAAREAFKTRLRDQVFEQAMDEVGAEAEKASTDELLARADGSALAGVKEALKQRLLDQVFQQAIAEIDAEVDVTPDDAAAFTEHEPAAETPATLSDEPEAMPHEDASFSSADILFADEEDTFSLKDEAVESDHDAPPLDVQFWDDEEAETADEATSSSVDFPTPGGDTPEGNESSFFLNVMTEEPGDDEVMIDDEWDKASVDDLLDLAGDGVWEDTVPYSDSLGDADAASEAAPIEDFVNDFLINEASEDPKAFVYYVYGILPSNSTAEDALPLDGIDPGYPVYPVVYEHGAALVSKVSAEEFGPEALAVNHLDPVWKEERNEAHEALIGRFSEDGLFLPVPFGTVYQREEDVAQLFSEISYQDKLAKIQDRMQWRVRLYRNVDVLHQQVVENSEAVQRLMADIKSKPKGGAHSIKKQMVSTIHEEEASLTDACTKDVHERLFEIADDVELGALEGESDRDKAELILDATYLVHEDRSFAFSGDIDRLVSEYATRGFEFDVTGPEPPLLFSQLHPFSKA